MLTRFKLSHCRGRTFFIFHIVQVAICFCFLKQKPLCSVRYENNLELNLFFIYILLLTKEKVLIKLFFKKQTSLWIFGTFVSALCAPESTYTQYLIQKMCTSTKMYKKLYFCIPWLLGNAIH